MLATYDPGLIVFTIGSIIVSGFSDGTFVTAERDEDSFSKRKGGQGDTVRVRNRNRDGSFSFSLQQTSLTNDLLTALLLADELNGTGIRPVQLKDLNGNTLVSAPAGWLRKFAPAGFGDDAENRDWIVDCYRMTPVIGGNIVVVP